MTPAAPTLAELTHVFGRIGVLSFGGPAAQIGLMHRELVEERDWLDEQGFLRALSFCMVLPGPEAMQLATYAGWQLRGVPGGLIAGLLFVLPGAALIAVLALAYAAYGSVPLVQAAFLGVKSAVIVIVLQALVKMSGKALTDFRGWAIALAAFLAIFAFRVPFPVIVLLAGIVGAFGKIVDPGPHVPNVQARTMRTVAILGAVWALPFVWLVVFPQPLLWDVAVFFSTLAVVTFGGAYAVLGYMTQTVVEGYGWLGTEQMIDALGLAETTPGPLILVTQFVAMLSGAIQGGTALALAAGAVALWVTFVPCFLWIFVGAPYLEWIGRQPRLAAALRGITAAVVGVILNLSLWFGLNVLFGRVVETHIGPARVLVPDLPSLDAAAVLLAIVAGALLLWRKWGILTTLAVMVGLGLATAWL